MLWLFSIVLGLCNRCYSFTGYAAERKSAVPVVVILRIGTTTIEIQVTGVDSGLHSARPIVAIVTCGAQSATVDVSSANEE